MIGPFMRNRCGRFTTTRQTKLLSVAFCNIVSQIRPRYPGWRIILIEIGPIRAGERSSHAIHRAIHHSDVFCPLTNLAVGTAGQM